MFTAPGGTMKTLKLIIAVAALAVVALPAVANASTISYDGSGALVYQGGAGEKNFFSYYADSGGVAISDSGPSTIDYPTDHCQPGWISYVVVCDTPTAIHASLGDRDDSANANGEIDVPVTFDGGAGADTLRGDINSTRGVALLGGPGDDRITGGAGADTLDGGDGVDELTGRDSTDQLNGGPGDDKLLGDAVNVDPAADVIDGGAGFDTVEGEWRKTVDSRDPITVTLAGAADDGRPGEHDDLRGVEHVVTNIHGTYDGSEGADDIDINQVTVASTVRGNGGDDTLDLSDADDSIDGGAGNDHIEGGNGNDRIVGGPGADWIHGDEPGGECSYIYCKLPSGNDTIDVRDGEADQVSCGVGTDTVLADAIDTVSNDCETINRTGTGTGTGGGPANGNGGDNGANDTSSLTIEFGAVKLRKALKSGVRVRFTAPAAGKVALVARRGSKVVATGSGTVRADGSAALTLKFSKAGRKALGRAKKASLTVDVLYQPSGGAAVQGQTKLTLKR
jgi:Ca2+-binding RTX toxin-like protein